MLHSLLVGVFAPHGGQHLIVLLFEGERGSVLRIHFQHLNDFPVGIKKIALALGLAGERQTGGGQSRNGLRRLNGNAGADLLRQRAGLLIKLGGAGQISARSGTFGVHQFLAQDNGVGLAQYRFGDSHVLGAVGLGR